MPKGLVSFLLVAVIAIIVHYFTFKLRYGWYTNSEEAAFLNAGFFLLFSVIFLQWVFFPTRIGVAIAGAAILVFPWALRPDAFPALDAPFVALSLIPIALLVGATHLRLHSKRAAC